MTYSFGVYVLVNFGSRWHRGCGGFYLFVISGKANKKRVRGV